ncbi:DUF1573 domain-containing protein [Pontibacter sp. G13]|uniref:DUF1573 domain-containing protein n=1 Tax=Pontibacter sp. G13 TaxID=3074898 RepID=UPI00288AF2DA|nr:DUF1573 domain-containing protein [Pontibacter sp. G13]WNJ16445.1 DUF1573 domain-containing protein [Pontibacter sp. G13]
MKRFFTLAAFVGCIAILAQAQLSTKFTNYVTSPALSPAATWETLIHEFGEIEQGTPAKHVFTVTNSGTEPLILTKVKPSCGCTVANYTKTEIAPGESGEVEATYNAQKMGVFSKTITVLTNVDDQATILKIRGEVK